MQEYKISKHKKIKKIVYINGLPPIFKNKKSYSIAVFQNLNIFNKKNYFFLKWFFSRDFIRYLKFKFFLKNIDEWIVFSESAERELSKYISKSITIKLLEYKQVIKHDTNIEKKYNFIYPATGGTHKNHNNLIKAMILLSEEKIYPSLLLTLSKKEINKLKLNDLIKKYNLNIDSKLYEYDKISHGYQISQALIFPSYNETLGLPLIECQKYNLDVVASELDFVRDSVKPNETFDPYSPLSISRAIKRYLKINDYQINNGYFLNTELLIEYLKKD